MRDGKDARLGRTARRGAAVLALAVVVAAVVATTALGAPLFDLTGAWTGYAAGAPNANGLQITMDGAGNITGSGSVSGESFTLGGAEDSTGAVTLKLIQSAAQFPPNGYTSTNNGQVAQGGNCFSGSWSDTNGSRGTFVWVRNGAAVSGAGTPASPYVCAMSASTTPLPPPVVGKTVNVMPVSGQVFVKLPASAAAAAFAVHGWLAARMGPLAKGQGFVALSQARQLPVGTQVDARRGRLALVSSAGVARQTYTGTFGGALFQVLQQRAQKGLTTLSLLEGAFAGAPSYSVCASAGKQSRGVTATAAAKLSAKVLQTLAASVKGRFSTRGRYSSATVRGTQWSVSDRCDGTLTRVRRGVVLVRDFARRRTIRVTAGHSYLARAP